MGIIRHAEKYVVRQVRRGVDPASLYCLANNISVARSMGADRAPDELLESLALSSAAVVSRHMQIVKRR